MKRSGAWWVKEIGNAMLRIRCAIYNGAYDEFSIAIGKLLSPNMGARRGLNILVILPSKLILTAKRGCGIVDT